MITCRQLRYILLVQLEMSEPIPPKTYHTFLIDRYYIRLYFHLPFVVLNMH